MARPIYILCCESVSQDRETGRTSFFHVIDGVEIHLPTADGPSAEVRSHIERGAAVPVAAIAFLVTSAWWRDEDEAEAVYEWEIQAISPDGFAGAKATGEFKFKTLFQRVQARMLLSPRRNALQGIMNLVSRIRRIDTVDRGEWIEQIYPLNWKVVVPEIEPDGLLPYEDATNAE